MHVKTKFSPLVTIRLTKADITVMGKCINAFHLRVGSPFNKAKQTPSPKGEVELTINELEELRSICQNFIKVVDSARDTTRVMKLGLGFVTLIEKTLIETNRINQQYARG